MDARATSLAMEFADLRLPLVQRASARKGGAGPRSPRADSASQHPGVVIARALHASNRSRRRLDRNRIAADCHLTVCA